MLFELQTSSNISQLLYLTATIYHSYYISQLLCIWSYYISAAIRSAVTISHSYYKLQLLYITANIYHSYYVSGATMYLQLLNLTATIYHSYYISQLLYISAIIFHSYYISHLLYIITATLY